MSETDLRVLAIRRHTSSCCPAIMVSPDGEGLARPAFKRKRLKAEKLIDFKVLEQPSENIVAHGLMVSPQPRQAHHEV
jgi:hypothetical protein